MKRAMSSLEIEAGRRERIRQAGVRVAGDKRVGLVGKLGEKRSHQIGTDRAVEADGERIVVPHPRSKTAPTVAAEIIVSPPRPTAAEIMSGSLILSSAKTSSIATSAALALSEIENRLDEQQVHPAGNERAHLAAIVGFALVEGDDAETRIIGIG